MKKPLIILLVLFFAAPLWAVDVRGPGYSDYPGHGTTKNDAPNGVGMICIVTDRTNDNGTLGDSTRNGIAVKTGSLRECINGNPGTDYEKIVLAEVNGLIESSGTNTEYIIDDPYTHIYGQTSPCSGNDCGLVLKNIQITMNTHDVSIHHVRIRATDDWDTGIDADTFSCLEGGDYANQVINHVSASWAPDSIFGFAAYGVNTWEDSTISYNIISMGIKESWHTQSPHSKGMTIGGVQKDSTMDDIAIIGNYILHNSDRNPNGNAEGDIDFLNNLQYNFGTLGYAPMYFYVDDQASGATLDHIGNFAKKGPTSGGMNEALEIFDGKEDDCSYLTVHTSDNVCYGYSNDYSSADPGGATWGACIVDDDNCEATSKSSTAINLPSGYTPYSALTVPNIALATSGLRAAGAFPAKRDAVDECLVGQFSAVSGGCGSTGNEQGCIPNDESDNCAYSALAETSHILNIPLNPHVKHSSGYTNLEVYIHETFTSVAEGRNINISSVTMEGVIVK